MDFLDLMYGRGTISALQRWGSAVFRWGIVRKKSLSWSRSPREALTLVDNTRSACLVDSGRALQDDRLYQLVGKG